MPLLPEFLKSISSPSITLVGPLFQPSAEFRNPSAPTIYIDGGARFREPTAPKNGSLKSLSVGDGDSYAGALDVTLPPSKDESDLAYVLRHIPQCINHVTMHGFLGGRRDHELANLGEIHAFLKGRSEQTRVDLTQSPNEFVIAFSHGSLTLEITQLFSVLVLESTSIQIKGDCRYHFPKQEASGQPDLLPMSSLGLSNVGFGSVRLVSPKPCFIMISR